MLRVMKSAVARDVRWWLKLICLVGMITLAVYSSVLSVHQHQERQNAVFGLARRSISSLDLDASNESDDSTRRSTILSITALYPTPHVADEDNDTVIASESASVTTTDPPDDDDDEDDGYRIKGRNVCRSDAAGVRILLSILVTSAPSHHVQRDTIRQTWGHFALRRDIRVAFVVGLSEDPDTEARIDEESLYFGDIIQLGLVDSYYNLTSKVMSMLFWASRYCDRTRFLLKTDDDMFINVPVLLDFLRARANVTNVIYGRIANRWKPARSKKSKWFVGPSEWKDKFYPNFVTGPAYLMSYDCVPKLLEAAEGTTPLKLEDVYTTGILAEKAGIRREGVKSFANVRPKVNNTCALSKIISAHDIKTNEMFDIWKRLQDPTRKRCKR